MRNVGIGQSFWSAEEGLRVSPREPLPQILLISTSHLTFLELTQQGSVNLACLSWLETHADSLRRLMWREDGVPIAILLTRVGPHVDSRWLSTIFEFMGDPDLGQIASVSSYAHAHNLAKTLRDRLKNKPTWPAIASQKVNEELVVTGLRDSDTAGWRRAMQLLECLIYDRGQRLTEAAATAMVKLAQAAPDLHVAERVWHAFSIDSLARSDLAAIREAFWITNDIDELRMTLAWLNLQPKVVEQVTRLRTMFGSREYHDLIRRLSIRRDTVSLDRWSESAELLASFDVAIPEPFKVTTDTAWIGQYPVVFHEVLRRLSRADAKAERVARNAIGGTITTAKAVTSEIKNLETLLLNQPDQGESNARAQRIRKRIENLKRQLTSPRETTHARQLGLIEKLQKRVGASKQKARCGATCASALPSRSPSRSAIHKRMRQRAARPGRALRKLCWDNTRR